VLDFNGVSAGGVAVDAVNAALNAAGAIYVGTAGFENTDLDKIYDIGYEYLFVPIGNLDAVQVWEGGNPEGTWQRPDGPDQLSWQFDERTYADFTVAGGCTPETECTAGFECGTDDNGCGGTINCGTCSGEDTCENNVCVPTGCVPLTECTAGFECGTDDNGCGGTINCGTCGTTTSCVDNTCESGLPNAGHLPAMYLLLLLSEQEDCVPKTECTAGFECGEEDDGCGGNINCGDEPCGVDSECVDNVCVED
jgi:hypothetical protein